MTAKRVASSTGASYACPRHRDDPVLERLAQGLEHGARELRRLVEQEQAEVGQRSRMTSELTGHL
jgi:hypothetical protein